VSPPWDVPRLPDCADEAHCSSPPSETVTPEELAWEYLLECLPVGWFVAPLYLLAAIDEWLAAAYNVRRCRAALSYVTWADADRLKAVSCLGTYFEGGTDAACDPTQHRRRN
jgi:hypothetical protein